VKGKNLACWLTQINLHTKQSLNIIGHRPVKGIDGEPLTNCEECDAPLTIPNDAIQGEIVSCKDCGASYEVKKDEASGLVTLKPAEKEQEDWGE
jgi:alpha-aminoadipate/glutamate carrier protein LysW